MAPPSVNTHTHTLDLTHHNVCFRDPIRYTCQLCIPNTHMHAGPSIPTLCISAKKTHNKGSRTQPIMSTLMPRSGIPVICSRSTLSCNSSYSRLFFIRSFSYLQAMMTCMRARKSLNFGLIEPLAAELAALESLKKSP